METLNWMDYTTSHGYVKHDSMGVRVLVSSAESSVAVQCVDPDTDELFDGWTDRPYESNFQTELAEAKQSDDWPNAERRAELDLFLNYFRDEQDRKDAEE